MSNNLTAEKIMNVFSQLGARIDQKYAKNSPVKIMVVGGAVSVLYRVRNATEDIDYCVEGLDFDKLGVIEEITEQLAPGLGLTDNFMNSGIAAFLGHAVWNPALDRTWQQAERLYTSPQGKLVVFTADYAFQLAAKLERITKALESEGQPSTKDLKDAAFYLNRYRETRGRRPTQAQVQALYRIPTDHHTPKISAASVNWVARTYGEVYGTPAFSG